MDSPSLSGLLLVSLASARQAQHSSLQPDALANTSAMLATAAALIRRLAILSPNESLDELSTPTLRCLLVPFYRAQCELAFRAEAQSSSRHTRDAARKSRLEAAKDLYNQYLDICRSYSVLSSQEQSSLFLFNTDDALDLSIDPSRQREARIAQFKYEREIQSQLQNLEQQLQAQKASKDSSSNQESQDEDEDDNDLLRQLLLSEIKLCIVRASSELSTIDMELELLKNAPPPSPPAASHSSADSKDAEAWRLDNVSDARRSWSDGGPILDTQGKVLRPFTILPSSTSSNLLQTRLRFQQDVFKPSHNLPSMSIDEFLDIEQDRGNIISGGGEASLTRETATERSERIRQGDDKAAYEEDERKVIEEREWDDFKDTHRRGDGNRMNKG